MYYHELSMTIASFLITFETIFYNTKNTALTQK